MYGLSDELRASWDWDKPPSMKPLTLDSLLGERDSLDGFGDVPLRHISDEGISFDVRPVWPRDHTDAATVGDTGLPRPWLQSTTLIPHDMWCACDKCSDFRCNGVASELWAEYEARAQ